MKSFRRLKDFDYNLPESLIAQKPARSRDHSRLLVIKTGEPGFKHRQFHEIEKLLRPGDILVLNDSKVIPARLIGEKPTGGKVEILLLRKINDNRWQALIKNLKTPQAVKLNEKPKLTARPVKNLGGGLWEIKFNLGGEKLNKILNQIGQTPTPPYIKRLSNLKEYQTIFARHPGSAAAPTAGFHFTRRLMDNLKKKGVEIFFVTLHVGLGTFQPIRTDKIENHKMHSEWAEIKPAMARKINQAKKEGRRVIAVGTTACRTLESFAAGSGFLKSSREEVDLFIKPGYKFKVLDGLITNFHLPKTTLLILVSAFLGFKEKNQTKGYLKLFRAYNEAIKKKYRFYSFGDAMFII